MENFKVGIAETDIELVTGMDMTGFLIRTSSSTGVHDNLKIKCLVIHDGIAQFVIIINDLLALDSRFTGECIDEASKMLDICPDNIVIACTHTHSGPASVFLQDCGEITYSWLESLKENILKCIAKAVNKLKPSMLAYKTAVCSIGYNRVVKDKDQSEILIDNQIGILEITDSSTGLVDGVLINYACHPVVLNGTLYSKDFPHYINEFLKQKYGYENAVIIYSSGCCGDIDPVERGDFFKAEKLGSKLADSIGNASTLQLDQKAFSQALLNIKSLKLNIPLAHDLDEAVIAMLQKQYYQGLEEKSRKGFDHGDEKVQKAYLHWTENMLSKLNNGTLEKSVCADIKIIGIGDFTIVTLPFEVFHDIGLAIKEHFGRERTIVICYANGDYGYFPSKNLYAQAEAGYEAGTAFRFYGYPGPVAYGAEDILLYTIFNT